MSFRHGGVGALGLGVIGKRGEELSETYEEEFEADDKDKPRQSTDSPSLLQIEYTIHLTGARLP